MTDSRGLTKTEFLALLTPEVREFLRESIVGGMSDYDNPEYYGQKALRDHTASVSAMCRNAHIVARARRAEVTMPTVKVRLRQGRVLFIIRDQVMVSFKKFNGRLRPANVPTQQAIEFMGQRLVEQTALGLAPSVSLTNIVAGYKLDAFGTGFEIYVTCPQDDENRWELKLSGANVTAFFSTEEPVPSEGTVVSRRVRVRSDARTGENRGATERA